MNPRQKASQTAIALIKRFEGYRPKAAQVPDGRWTIGYGHTKTARQGAQVSEADAEALLIYDLMDIQAAVEAWTFTPLTQNQFDALTAFAFNIGLDNFRTSQVLRRVNEGDLVLAAGALEMWRRAQIDGEDLIVDGLIRRRSAEKALFLTPPQAFAPTPSAIVRPQLDHGVEASLPKSVTEVVVAMDGDRGEARAAPTDQPQLDLEPPPAEPPQPQPALADPQEIETFEAPAAAPDAPPPSAPFDLSRRIVRREAPAEHDGKAAAGKPAKADALQLWALGSLGLAMFAAAVTWAARAKATAALPDTLVIATMLGVAGIVCVSAAVYFLLIRLTGRGD